MTIGNASHLVTQVFCSGWPISYTDIPIAQWNYFPRLILDATYEATFHVAVQNLTATGGRKLYLTLVGGGVFGNRLEWILAAIGRALALFAWADLDVYIVSYGTSNPEVDRLLDGFPAGTPSHENSPNPKAISLDFLKSLFSRQRD